MTRRRRAAGIVVWLVAVLLLGSAAGGAQALPLVRAASTPEGTVQAASSWWHPCLPEDFDKPPKITPLARAYKVKLVAKTSVKNMLDVQQTMKLFEGQKFSTEVETSVKGSLEGERVLKVALEAGWTQKTYTEKTKSAEQIWTVPAGRHLQAEVWLKSLYMVYRSTTYVEMTNGPFGFWCRDSEKTSLPRVATIPSSDHFCWWYGEDGTTCDMVWDHGSPGGGGVPPGGGTPPSPTGPQPVTDVRGLADGTLLSTTDTGRVYKMVGGAPVWQATCEDGICASTPRPTTQAVIDAGPRTPRNGSTAVDQRGRVYLFVGGAPLWQEGCEAPVTCGTPVKVSSWSVDARDHMNQRPADGQLVQAKAGSTDLPVSVTVGGALIPFATPQEVIDAGYGSDWAGRVVAISPGSYNGLGTIPADGTLVQGASGGVSTPVAMILGGAAIPFASPQEVIDAGYGNDWTSKVRGIPSRHFHSLPPIPQDGTLIQGSLGSTPVAAIMGGGRVNFASPQEVIDSGFGTDWPSKVRAVPARAFSALPTQIVDGTRLGKVGATSEAAVVGGARVDFHSETERNDAGYGDKPLWKLPARVWDGMTTQIADGTRIANSGTTGEAAVVGGARVDFHSESERNDAGYGDEPRQVIPARVWDAMTTRIADGTRIGKSGSTGEAAVVGGARVDFHSETERNDAGYGDKLLQMVPARVWDGMTTQIADGTRIAKSGSTGEAAVVGGARVDFHSESERNDAGYGTKPRQVIPARVWDGMTTQIADGTRIVKSGTTGEAAVVGGARVAFHSMEELQGAGYGAKPRQVIPARVWDGMTTQIADGTRIVKSGTTGEAAVVGGARVDFHSMEELQGAGYGAKPRQVIPARVWDSMTTRIADGTLIKAPGSADVWRVSADRRHLVTETGTTVWTVPQRVIDAIPVG
ncbi:hypothetical protein [Streptomyces lateritius]|uniref:hypothetical protein n=1 Tax=Streptomyces lateritius TaxID=67313 RepID=UPI001C8B473D|nr:hypothetical protein [Streptomyces lateritius]MBX9420851.1 hypothetical protein [Streptomyces lateritius]